MMDFCVKGFLWMIFILLTPLLLHCNNVCPDLCQCRTLSYISCSGRSATDMLQQLGVHTYTLLLDKANMNDITEKSLADKTLLLRFGLTNSHLHTIHPLAFHVSPQLKSLKFTGNNLTTLPARVFSPLSVVEEIYLDSNQLEVIGPEMFEGLNGLIILDLSSNRIRNLPPDMFDGLTSLIILNLGRNNIKTLHPTMFRSLTKLQRLRIYHNELELLEGGIFDQLVNLQSLNLHHNQINHLPPQVFWSLGNLTELTLSSNHLQYVPSKSFYNMSELKKLTIYSNPLLSLPDELMGHMPHITQFYLYNTSLTSVPGNLFSNMSGLVELNLHLNDELRYLPPDLFCCLPNLKKLSLRNNRLKYLHPDLFHMLTKMNILLLNDNKLSRLPGNIFQDLTSVVTMDLKNNNLNSLPGDIFLSNTVLKSLTLSGNPWDCDCAIRGLTRWLKQNVHVVLDRDDVICHNPLFKLLRHLHSLLEDEFSYCDEKRATTILQTQTDSYKETETSHYTSVNPFQKSTTLETTTYSKYFYDILVVHQGPAYVHHKIHKGWVSVWFLPSGSALVGSIMFCYILLLAMGLALVLAAIYSMHRLNTAVDKLKAKCAHGEEHVMLSGLVHT
ncbi:platelet glycoprotein V [Cyprinodon tularosa]|uniref:platelet glycoprotein V n=1 Tax=Cyprinodon tularosa TaxID=77115 RepID=UPI0018E1F835|nr:platelet glycoprotein V [Cyprinodon tularosa]